MFIGKPVGKQGETVKAAKLESAKEALNPL